MENKEKKILVVDDEPDIVELLEYNLEQEGYTVKHAYDGEEAIKVANDFAPHVILLDIMLPKLDGVEVCRQLRESGNFSNTYVLFLTARAEEYSEVAAFDSGADDYIVKPIKPRALMSRLSAYFRRKGKKAEKESKVEVGSLSIDRSSYTVLMSGEKVVLPRKEFELLYFLASNPNNVFSREDLLNKIWGNDVYVLARTVDVHIRKVREKIGDNFIKTVKGVGYKFDLAGNA